MAMERNSTIASATAETITSATSSANAETTKLILIVEAMHLGRGKGSTTLTNIHKGLANKAREKYIVVHLPLKTEAGGSEMRALVASEVHRLIQHHRPHQVTIATDYNIGSSGGACTLQEFSAFLTNPIAELNLPTILVDNKTLRAERTLDARVQIKAQNQARQLVIINYVLFGGDLAALNEACEVFAAGKDSHWMKWQGHMRKLMQPSTPNARSQSAVQATHTMTQSTPNISVIHESGNDPIHSDRFDLSAPFITRTMSLPTTTHVTSTDENAQMQSPSFSGSGTPYSFDGSNFSPESLPPSASPERSGSVAELESSSYQLTPMPPMMGMEIAGPSPNAPNAPTAPTAPTADRLRNVILPEPAQFARFRQTNEDRHYNALIGKGELYIPKTIMFNKPVKLNEFTRRNSLEDIKHPSPHHATLAKPAVIPVTTSPTIGVFNGVSPSRFTTSQTGKGSPAGMFARRIAALRVDVTAPLIDPTSDVDLAPTPSPKK
jgi:hypothetical protein